MLLTFVSFFFAIALAMYIDHIAHTSESWSNMWTREIFFADAFQIDYMIYYYSMFINEMKLKQPNISVQMKWDDLWMACNDGIIITRYILQCLEMEPFIIAI